MAWSMWDIGCCCEEGNPNECIACDEGTTLPDPISVTISGVTETMSSLDFTETHDPPESPWDNSSPQNLELTPDFNKTRNVPQTASFCLWRDDLWVFNTADPFNAIHVAVRFALQVGPYTGQFGQISPGIGTSDDVVAALYIESQNAFVEFAKIVHTDIPTNGLPDCIGLLPITFTSGDVAWEDEGTSDDHSIPNFLQATIVVDEP